MRERARALPIHSIHPPYVESVGETLPDLVAGHRVDVGLELGVGVRVAVEAVEICKIVEAFQERRVAGAGTAVLKQMA